MTGTVRLDGIRCMFAYRAYLGVASEEVWGEGAVADSRAPIGDADGGLGARGKPQTRSTGAEGGGAIVQ
jgi:hypothetical protein